MSQSNRGFRGKSAVSFDRSFADVPENFGNRRTFEEMRIPPDNVGNKIEHDPIATFIHDGLGNSLDEEPAHLKSGILTHLMGIRERMGTRRPIRRDQPAYDNPRSNRSHAQAKTLIKKASPSDDHDNEMAPVEASSTTGEDYMATLIKEFAKLLREKSGLPFSFSMKPVNDHSVDQDAESENLGSLKTLIEGILQAALINASVSMVQYCTAHHRFAVFFINPSERDPVRNKELISALRQVVKLHSAKFPVGEVNVLLVLANAESVIEDHLYKIGAKKIEP